MLHHQQSPKNWQQQEQQQQQQPLPLFSPPSAASVSSQPLAYGLSQYGTPVTQVQGQRYDRADSSTGTPTSNSQHAPFANHQDSHGKPDKRMYRQRRKDPSCDQCRERKVKCDATDSRSCTECKARHGTCRFTKDTNRRMSSLKQVQDLEARLQAKDQQISQLQDMLAQRDTIEGRDQDLDTMEVHNQAASPIDPVVVPKLNNFFRVRRNIRNYSRGIFKPPIIYRTPAQEAVCPLAGPKLPPKHVVEFLMSKYQAFIHSYLPILHWPAFTAEVDAVYRQGNFQGSRVIWIAVFYSVLLCSSLFVDQTSLDETGIDRDLMLSTALTYIDLKSDDSTVDHVRVSLLFSVYFYEENKRTTAAAWLSSAIRFAQCCGLHINVSTGSPGHSEIKTRVWWSLLLFDRLCSLDSSVPLVIADKESESNVAEPAPVDDTLLQMQDFHSTAADHDSNPAALLILAPVIRIVNPSFKRLLRSKTLASPTLKTYDDHFHKLQEAFPGPFSSASAMPLDPQEMPAALILHVIRFIFNRHNLSPLCRPQERQEALRRCVEVARDTAHILYRSTPAAHAHQTPPTRLLIHPADTTDQRWQTRIRCAVPSIACTHIWRSVLVLALCGEYAPALTCVGVMRAIGSSRAVNSACGRYLAFFLDRITQALQTDESVSDLQNDEELLAYASGDLQGDQHNAWAWQGSEMILPDEVGREGFYSNGRSDGASIGEGAIDGGGIGSTLTAEEANDWGGWDHVENLLRNLHRRLNASKVAGEDGLRSGFVAGPMSAPPNPGLGFGFKREPVSPSHYNSRASLSSSGGSAYGSSQQQNGPRSAHPIMEHYQAQHGGPGLHSRQPPPYTATSPGPHTQHPLNAHGYVSHSAAPNGHDQGSPPQPLPGMNTSGGPNGHYNPAPLKPFVVPQSGNKVQQVHSQGYGPKMPFVSPTPGPGGPQSQSQPQPQPQPQSPYEHPSYVHLPALPPQGPQAPHVSQSLNSHGGKPATAASRMRINDII